MLGWVACGRRVVVQPAAQTKPPNGLMLSNECSSVILFFTLTVVLARTLANLQDNMNCKGLLYALDEQKTTHLTR
jgi:hypothetical protein